MGYRKYENRSHNRIRLFVKSRETFRTSGLSMFVGLIHWLLDFL